MPRKMPTRDFVINQLRYLASWKRTPPSTRLRALFALAVIEDMLKVNFNDGPDARGVEVAGGEKETNEAVNKMLDAALNMRRRDAN